MKNSNGLIEKFEKEYAELAEIGVKANPLRLEYEKKVRALAEYRDNLYDENKSEEEIARLLHDARRELGREYKDAAPPLFREYIFYATAKKYGDPLGPDYEMLSSRKTAAEIIDSAVRPIRNLDNRLTLEGFREWFYSEAVEETQEGERCSRRNSLQQQCDF